MLIVQPSTVRKNGPGTIPCFQEPPPERIRSHFVLKILHNIKPAIDGWTDSLLSTALPCRSSIQERHQQLGYLRGSTLFHSKRDGLIKNPGKWFAIALEQAKINGSLGTFTVHTFASRLVMAGVDLEQCRN